MIGYWGHPSNWAAIPRLHLRLLRGYCAAIAPIHGIALLQNGPITVDQLATSPEAGEEEGLNFIVALTLRLVHLPFPYFDSFIYASNISTNRYFSIDANVRRVLEDAKTALNNINHRQSMDDFDDM